MEKGDMRWDSLWNVDGSDHGGSKHGLFALHQLFQEVDRDIIIRWQKDTDIAGQKIVYFTFRSIAEVLD